MKDYYMLIEKYCMSRCYTFEDLVDKKRLKQHNSAMNQLVKLEKEMFAKPDRCADVVWNLLAHSDERVRLLAGAYCIHAQIYIEEGMQVLRDIKNHSESKYMRVSAEQNINYCTPFVNTST